MQSYSVTADSSGKFDVQYPMFLNTHGISQRQFQYTMDEASRIIKSSNAYIVFLFLIGFTVSGSLLLFIGLPLAIIMALTVVGLILLPLLLCLLVPALCCDIMIAMTKSGIKTKLKSFLDEENQQKYYSKGIQFLVVYHEKSRFMPDKYEIQIMAFRDPQEQKLSVPRYPTKQLPAGFLKY